MKSIRLVVVAVISLAGPSAVMAESVGDYIDRSKEIETLDFQIEKLKRQLRQAELNHEIKNVGKEKPEAQDSRLSDQRIDVRDYSMSGSQQASQKDDKPSYEELAERQKDRALDGAFIASVFGHAGSGNMTAEIFLENKGVVEVVEGEQVGNWEIIGISLRSIEAEHIKTGDTKRLTSKSSSQ